MNEWIPTWCEWVVYKRNTASIDISFYRSELEASSHAKAVVGLCEYVRKQDFIDQLSQCDVLQQMRDKPLSERISKPSNKYSREIKPNVWVDVYDTLAAFTGLVSEKAKPAVDHAVKKLLAPGLRGHKEERQDLIEARDSLDRAIQQLDEWA